MVVVVVVVLKGTLVFCFGPNLKLRFWPRPKLNNLDAIREEVEYEQALFSTFTGGWLVG